MPNISDLTHQHRQVSGNHTLWLDKKNGTQNQQDQCIKQLGNEPGSHARNRHRREFMNAAVQLLSILSYVKNSRINPAISRSRAEKITAENRLHEKDARHLFDVTDRSVCSGLRSAAQAERRARGNESGQPQFVGNSTIIACHDNISASAELTEPQSEKNILNPCLVSHLIDVRQAAPDSDEMRQQHAESVASSLWQRTQDYYASVSEIVSQYDPLRFAGADAAQVTETRHANKSVSAANNQATKAAEADSDNRERENKKLTFFLQRQGVLDEHKSISDFSKEERVAAVGGWLFGHGIQSAIQSRRKVKRLAKLILSASNLYGGKSGERISYNQAESAIKNWGFATILGTSLSEYIAREIARDPHPGYITISSIRQLLSLEKLHQAGRLNLAKIPAENWGGLNAMWFTWLRKEIPFLYLNEQDTATIATDSLAFADLYSGSRYLADTDSLNRVNLTETIMTGSKLWEQAVSNGIEPGKMSYFLLPSLLYLARRVPEKVNMERGIYAISATAINSYIHYREEVRAAQQDLSNKFDKYQSSVREWLGKRKLADKIVATCPQWELPSLSAIREGSGSALAERALEASSMYMNGVAKPCRSAPESLTEEYQRLSENVAKYFGEIDKYLIWAALGTIQKEDADFISSPEAIVYPISLTMRTSRMNIPVYNYLYDRNFNVNLDKTDIFSVNVANEERVYALKGHQEDHNGGYDVIRVDRNIVRYIESDILDYKKFGSNYKLEENEVKVEADVFTFSFYTDKKNPLSQGGDNENLVNYLNRIHRDTFYLSLYEAGNDQTDIQKVWGVVKHMIPFYDCVTGIIDNNPAQAIPACLLDAVSFIPVFGQAARMSGNFGIGLTRGIRSGLAAAGRESVAGASQAAIRAITLPTALELGSLGKNTLRNIDPGFELLGGAGKKFAEKLIYQLSKEKNSASLAEKLAASELLDLLPSTSDSFISARLPDSDISVPVKKVANDGGHDVYAMVNPDTGEIAGKYFQLPAGSEHLRYHFPNRPAAMPRNPALEPQGIPDLNLVSRLHHFLPPMNSIRLPNIQIRDVTNAIRVDVISGYQENQVHIHNFVDRVEHIPPEFTWLRSNLDKLKADITRAMETVKSIRAEMHAHYRFTEDGWVIAHNSDNYISKYIKQAFGTENKAIINEGIKRFSHYIDRISTYFDEHNADILMATARRNDMVYRAVADAPNGFTYLNDMYQRIILMVDRFEGIQMYNNDLAVTVLHEASHAAAGTADFFLSAHTADVGEANNIIESLDDILVGLESEFSFNIDRHFLSAYMQSVGTARPTHAQFLELVRRDPMLKANIIMDNADTLANMINDIYKESVTQGAVRQRRDAVVNLNTFQKTLLSLVANNLNLMPPSGRKIKNN